MLNMAHRTPRSQAVLFASTYDVMGTCIIDRLASQRDCQGSLIRLEEKGKRVSPSEVVAERTQP
eukprot:6192840-Pleurochrysis_carterae.AAC.3